MTLVMGADPGSRDGACVLMDADGVVHDYIVWWSVQRQKRSMRVVATPCVPGRLGEGMDIVTPDLLCGPLMTWAQSGPVRLQGGYHLVLEKVTPQRNSSTTVLIESAGMLLGHLRPFASGPAERPMAQQWRRDVLGLPWKTGAKEAEALAIERAQEDFAWGRVGRWPGEPKPRMPKVAQGALAEAAYMAWWGLQQREAA